MGRLLLVTVAMLGHIGGIRYPRNIREPVAKLPNIIVKIDDPLFLLSELLDDISLNSGRLIDELLSGRWCETLTTFGFPLFEDDDEYLELRPVDNICKTWRLCRDQLLSLSSCKAVRHEKMYKVSIRSHGRYDTRFFCSDDVNTIPCLQKHCECDLEVSFSVLDYAVNYLKAQLQEQLSGGKDDLQFDELHPHFSTRMLMGMNATNS